MEQVFGKLAGVINLKRLSIGVPVLMLMLLAMIVLPLPPLLLDVFFTFNIALAMVVMLVAVYSNRPLDFGLFPTVILVATLLRLGLNVASTRVVLLEGHTGTDAAGKVIQSFGEFVVGGNYAVGLVVFVILVIINFVVVTKGAGRISEVTARFTLDAMPGKQMAIDADLNSGLIDQHEAKRRREEIGREADFYGSMDGASKFVRGDAVAGILITLINILGGLAIGVLQHNLSMGEASQNYTLLAIGDGLVAQIPALLLSSATGIIVTRMSGSQDMGQQVIKQLFADPRTLGVTAGLVGVMGVIPGMPNAAFLTLATIAGAGAWYMHRRRKEVDAAQVQAQQQKAEQTPPPEARELGWDDVLPVDPVGLEVGYRLIPMVDKNQGGQLMPRIKGVRKKLSQELGFLIPPVHIRDNLDLEPNRYRLLLMGVAVGESEVFPDRDLAINPGQVFGELPGSRTIDPSFGLEAIWIEPAQRDQAQSLGYTVVDANTVVATHLSQVLQNHAHELLGHDETQQLLDKLAKSLPKLVEELVPGTLSLGQVAKVLQGLLREGVPVRDMRTIAEALAEHAPKSKEPTVLVAMVRVALGRMIVQSIFGIDEELTVITLDPTLEQILQKSVSGGEQGGMEPGLAERLLDSLREAAREQEMAGRPAVLLVPATLRALLARFVMPSIPTMKVLSYNEIPDNRQIRIVANVGGGGQS